MSSEESAGEIDENDLEFIDRGEDIEELENSENPTEGVVEPSEQNEEGQTQEEEAENKKAVKPKRVVKNPQPKLNERTLQEPRGLAALPGHFDRVKFKGRGYEQQDLNVLMKTYEYWCHRMIPKFTFDDCIARLETLGSKKVTQTQIKRIRMGINFDQNDEVISENEDDAAISADETNAQFDQLVIDNNAALPTLTPIPELSDAQLEKIRQNKERAQRLREERLKAIREKAQNNLQTSDRFSQNSQSSQADPDTDISTITLTNNVTTIEEDQRNNIEVNAENIPDNEDNIEKILDYINTDEPTSTKLLSPVLGTADKQKSTSPSPRTKTSRRRIVESDEESEDDIQIQTHSKNTRKIIDSDEEEENMDIDNMLTEINADNTSNSDAPCELEYQNKIGNLNDNLTDTTNEESMGINGEVNTTDHVTVTPESEDVNCEVTDKENLENDLNVANNSFNDVRKNTLCDDNIGKGFADTICSTNQTGKLRTTEGLESNAKEVNTITTSENVIFQNCTQEETVIRQVEASMEMEVMDTTN